MRNAIKSLGHVFTLRWLLALFGALISPVSQAEIKCWTNAEAVRECGDTVPPEFAQGGHRVLSTQGVELSTQQRAKTQAELDEERRVAEQQREAERRREESARTDRVLLDAYSSEDDLLLARDGKLVVLDGQIKWAEGLVEKLRADIANFTRVVAEAERKSQPVPEKTAAEIETLTQEIKKNQALMISKQEEKKAAIRQFERDLQRYRTLTAAR